MTQQELLAASKTTLQELLKTRLPPGTAVYLFGSRARDDERWNSDFDLWVDAKLTAAQRLEIAEFIDDSFIPFKVDIVSTTQLKEAFGDQVRREARRWI